MCHFAIILYLTHDFYPPCLPPSEGSSVLLILAHHRVRHIVIPWISLLGVVGDRYDDQPMPLHLCLTLPPFFRQSLESTD